MTYYDYAEYLDYGSKADNTGKVVTIISLVLAAAAVVLAFIFFMSAKKRDKLPKGLKILHDICNSNLFFVELILKAAYIFFTVYYVIYGFINVFTTDAWEGFKVMLLNPIKIRLYFEFGKLAILLVKNVISINKKLKAQDGEDVADGIDCCFAQYKSEKKAPVAPAAPAAQAAPAAPAAAASFCPNCGTKLSADSAFCAECGTKVQ